jgi:membrane associated rhomboid family serine protease
MSSSSDIGRTDGKANPYKLAADSLQAFDKIFETYGVGLLVTIGLLLYVFKDYIQVDNSPVTLFLVVGSFLVQLLKPRWKDLFAPKYDLFVSPSWNSIKKYRAGAGNWLDKRGAVLIFRCFSHGIGHADWGHLVGNCSTLLLTGPGLEAAYGSFDLLLYVVVALIVGSVVNWKMSPSYRSWGASGIVFEFVLLSGLVRRSAGTLPLTFILLVALRIPSEAQNLYAKIHGTSLSNTNNASHLAGALIGAVFGFLAETYQNDPDVITLNYSS